MAPQRIEGELGGQARPASEVGLANRAAEPHGAGAGEQPDVVLELRRIVAIRLKVVLEREVALVGEHSSRADDEMGVRRVRLELSLRQDGIERGRGRHATTRNRGICKSPRTAELEKRFNVELPVGEEVA